MLAGVVELPVAPVTPTKSTTKSEDTPGTSAGEAVDGATDAEPAAQDASGEPEQQLQPPAVDISKMSLRDQAAYMLRQQQSAAKAAAGVLLEEAGAEVEAEAESEDEEQQQEEVVAVQKKATKKVLATEDVHDQQEGETQVRRQQQATDEKVGKGGIGQSQAQSPPPTKDLVGARSPEQAKQTKRQLSSEGERTSTQRQQRKSPAQKQRKLASPTQRSPPDKTRTLKDPKNIRQKPEAPLPSNQERTKGNSLATKRPDQKQQGKAPQSKKLPESRSRSGSSSTTSSRSSSKHMKSAKKMLPASVSSKMRKGPTEKHRKAPDHVSKKVAGRNKRASRDSNGPGYSYEDNESVSGWDNGEEQPGRVGSNTVSHTASKISKPKRGSTGGQAKVNNSRAGSSTAVKRATSPSRGPSRKHEGRRSPKTALRDVRARSPPDGATDAWMNQVDGPKSQRKSSSANTSVAQAEQQQLQRFACPPMLMHYAHCPKDIGSVGKGHPMLWLIKEVNSSPNMNKVPCLLVTALKPNLCCTPHAHSGTIDN
jgi:hypothetical protein